MITRRQLSRAPADDTAGSALLAKPVAEPRHGDLERLRAQARQCRACPLWKPATQTVFGEGPQAARVVLIGEQPGNAEDLAGRPFVGPAGALLDRALGEARLERERLYLTNTVKHFKFEPRGKLRLHKRANAAEQAACRGWLAAELAAVEPQVVVALGAMAAQTLFGAQFSIVRQRGEWRVLAQAVRGMATRHPSAVLRAPAERRAQLYQELVADLCGVRARLCA